MEGSLPGAPAYGLVVKESDLVVSTHSRAFCMLDGLTPLRELTTGRTPQDLHEDMAAFHKRVLQTQPMPVG
ncbi:MAG TPA: hypothetical protein VNK95_02510 [Caldilineaceae bacterium]|nr:hypothetical protein [Caldilineaceae bacterium]